MFKLIRNIIEFFAGRQIFIHREKCVGCLYLRCTSNHSPCYECKCNDQYESKYEFDKGCGEVRGDS